jgi:hypothetical protein
MFLKTNIFLIFNLISALFFVQSCANSKDGFAPGLTGSIDLPSSSPGGGTNGGGTGSSTSKNCQQVLAANSSATSGIYSISFDGSGSVSSTISVYCDMTTNGGGWTLVMKQKSGDGVTLKGDSIYFSSVSATTLNDVNSNRGMSDENLVSKAYQVVPVTQMMLVAANELTVKTQSVSATSALGAFDMAPTDYSDDVNSTRPNWFITTLTYPNGTAISGARFGFNFRERYLGGTNCSARWGWSANENPSGSAAGSHDSCGGLGAYGAGYGGSLMNNSTSVWQPATLYLYVK